MSAYRDPPRLMDHAADPELRQALRVVVRDEPSPAVLALLAERAQAATQHSPGSGPAREPKWTTALKLTLVTCTGAAILYGSLRVAERRAPPKPPLATEMRQDASPTLRADPVAPTPARPGARPAAVRRQSDSNEAAYEPPATRASAPPLVTADPSTETRTPPTAARRSTTLKRQALPPARAGAVPSALDRARGPALPSELQLLESAQAALAQDPNRSLELVDQHRRLYPDGAFAQERDVLELEVLSRLGRLRELGSRARLFLEHNPRSAHKSRVAMLLGAASGSAQ